MRTPRARACIGAAGRRPLSARAHGPRGPAVLLRSPQIKHRLACHLPLPVPCLWFASGGPRADRARPRGRGEPLPPGRPQVDARRWPGPRCPGARLGAARARPRATACGAHGPGEGRGAGPPREAVFISLGEIPGPDIWGFPISSPGRAPLCPLTDAPSDVPRALAKGDTLYFFTVSKWRSDSVTVHGRREHNYLLSERNHGKACVPCRVSINPFYWAVQHPSFCVSSWAGVQQGPGAWPVPLCQQAAPLGVGGRGVSCCCLKP